MLRIYYDYYIKSLKHKLEINKVYEENKNKDIGRKQKLIATANKLDDEIKAGKNVAYNKLALKQMLSDIKAINTKYGINEAEKNKKLAADKTSAKSAIPSMSGAGIEKALGMSTGAKKTKITPDVMQQKPTALVTDSVDEQLTPNALNITDTVTETPITKSNNNNQMLGKDLGLLGDAAQSIGNYAIPFQQYKMGQKFLAETGPRPKDKIDPEFQNVINKAQANATYGYTPQEQSLLDQQNVNALRAGQSAATFLPALISSSSLLAVAINFCFLPISLFLFSS